MNIRKEALSVFIDIVEDGAYSNIRLKEITASKEETASVCALVYAGLEHLYWADYMLSFYVKRQKRIVRNILRLAVSELFFMHSPDYAVVNEAVSICRLSGKKECCGLVNGVLRAIIRDRNNLPALPAEPVKRLHVLYSVPEDVISQWIDDYGLYVTEKMLEKREPCTEVRAQWPNTTENLIQLFPQAVRGTVCNDCLILPTGILTPQNDLFKRGEITFQSEGAMAICQMAGDVKGKKVLDACAAPGGKSAYLYSLAAGDIDLTCFEYYEHRTEVMRSSFQRLHVKADILTKDAGIYDETYYGLFDLVLIDAPCSGLGLIHTKPDIGIAKEDIDFTELCETQKRILDVCSSYVKHGGILLYATCTVSQCENERVTAFFINSHPGFILEDYKQLLPNINGSGGYYMARFRCI